MFGVLLCSIVSGLHPMTGNQKSSPKKELKKRKNGFELKQDDNADEPLKKKAFIAPEKTQNTDSINESKSNGYDFPTFASLMDGEDASENQSSPSNDKRRATKISDNDNENEITQTSPSRSTPHTSTSPQRTPTTQGIFMRNPAKLKKLTPRSKDKAIKEAAALTPYLTAMYKSQYPTRDPQNITPLHSQKTRRKSKIPSAARLTSQDVIKTFTDADISVSWFGNVETFTEQGYTVYQTDQLIDLNKRDSENRTNKERMNAGNAPIGPGGEINLHHLTRQDPGPLIEISGYTHRRESGVVHASTGIVGSERQSFDTFRRWYWKQRVQQMMENGPTAKNAEENQKESKLNELDSLTGGISKITIQILKKFVPKGSSEETKNIITAIIPVMHNLSNESFNLEDLVTTIMQSVWDGLIRDAIDSDQQTAARKAFEEKLIALLNEESFSKILIATGILLFVEHKQQEAKAQDPAEAMSLKPSVHTPSSSVLRTTPTTGMQTRRGTLARLLAECKS